MEIWRTWLEEQHLIKYLLYNKAFNVAKNSKYDGYQHGLPSMVHKFPDKKSSVVNISGGAIENKIMSNQRFLDLPTRYELI